ncbi:MAG: ribokinase [Actinomycetota bacterium]
MSVLVLASLNADLVVAVDTRPAGGETVLGGDLVVHPGGKGANQAAAAALAGATVRVVGRVGDDAYGELLRTALASVGADVTGVTTTPGAATGIALITVTPDGENSIVVASGANAHLTPDDVGAVTDDVLVTQLELPMPAVEQLARACVDGGHRLVLNAAPPRTDLPEALLAACDPLVVNAHEAAALTGTSVATTVEDAVVAAQALQRKGCRSVVLTLGAAGAVVLDGDGCWHVAPPSVAGVVDTTGAGDCLVGTLAARLDAGDDLATATADAVRTATLAVLTAGAQTSYVPRDQALAVPVVPPRPLRAGGTDAAPGASNRP